VLPVGFETVCHAQQENPGRFSFCIEAPVVPWLLIPLQAKSYMGDNSRREAAPAGYVVQRSRTSLGDTGFEPVTSTV
jgi:hypothetical protein